ncbi:MAG: hypothetical protein NVSMB29_13520 [Candidatus Dormibacteria bacterium]
MSTPNAPETDHLVSRDGVLIGPILGIHRDPVSRAARWAVVDAGQRQLVVPLQGATTESGTLRVPHDASQLLGSPPVADPTRLLSSDETALTRHYGSAQWPDPPAAAAQSPQDSTTAARTAGDLVLSPADEPGGTEADLSVVRSEEQLVLRSLEWRPYQRVRLRTVVRSREETHVVRVRWEELVIENEPVSAVERLEMASGLVQPDSSDVQLVLHREEVTVTTRVVPYEWVHATRSPVLEDLQVTETVRKEMVDVQHEQVGPNGSGAAARRGGKP